MGDTRERECHVPCAWSGGLCRETALSMRLSGLTGCGGWLLPYYSFLIPLSPPPVHSNLNLGDRPKIQPTLSKGWRILPESSKPGRCSVGERASKDEGGLQGCMLASYMKRETRALPVLHTASCTASCTAYYCGG